MTQEFLHVRGAKVNNLRNVDCQIPYESLTVITGVSGSGKSSLAFDTIYAEGQRRYVESLSAYARQFLDRVQKPDVEDVVGVSPSIAIKQKNNVRNPRSTVGTITEFYDYLRLLFARIGHTFCPKCKLEVKNDILDNVVDQLLTLPEDSRLYLLFPFVDYRRFQELKKSFWGDKTINKHEEITLIKVVLQDLRKHGFNRLYQKEKIYDLSNAKSLNKIDLTAKFDILVDRIIIQSDLRQRLTDSLESCYREGSGKAIVEIVGLPRSLDLKLSTQNSVSNKGEEQRLVVGSRFFFNEGFVCRRCQTRYEAPKPNLFSFNSPVGACPFCQGFGNKIDYDLKKIVPDPEKSLKKGAIEPWTKPRYRRLRNDFKQFAQRHEIPWEIPYCDLSSEQKKLIYKGDKKFKGIKRFFDYLETKKYKIYIRVFLSRYRGYARCPECSGSRLRLEARAVKVAGKEIGEITSLTVEEAIIFFNSLVLSSFEFETVEKILEEIKPRLRFLYQVGLEYLTLDRLTSTLSGGEAQRIQLAASLGSSLVGALYVLDEPSIGLHPRDNSRLIKILKNLRDIGNTVLVVEHEPSMIQSADRIIDMGPGAGEHGGKVVFSGSFQELMNSHKSITARYLNSELSIPIPHIRMAPNDHWLKIYGAQENNLRKLDVDIPLGIITCVTGVSGSGKSTLVHQVLYSALKARKGELPEKNNYENIQGDDLISDVVLVDQSPIGRTPRSNPVTYVKAFDGIRQLFASTHGALSQGLGAGHFSFNIPGGRCETCQGSGTVTVEMQFLADVELVCEECKGKRFKPNVLNVLYKGHNINQILQLTVREALKFFPSTTGVTKRLQVLRDVGLDYLRLGQSATTLSGGEAQRVRLASYLSKQVGQNTLFIFDEPTTGLHFDDISKLLRSFRRLIRGGATILVIEHNLEVIKTSDWIIDLGPEGGDKGGKIVATGSPEQIASVKESYTGQFLQKILPKNEKESN